MKFEVPEVPGYAVAEVVADSEEKGDNGEQRKATAGENSGKHSDKRKQRTHHWKDSAILAPSPCTPLNRRTLLYPKNLPKACFYFIQPPRPK